MKVVGSQWVVVSLILNAMLFAPNFPVEAQQQKVPRIGLLDFATPEAQSARNKAFRQGLRDLGYIEGKNIIIEYRSAREMVERLPDLAAELIRLKVDVIVTQNPPVARIVSESTKTIPIVNAGGGDLVSAGVVTSLSRPGGNVTGLTSLTAELSAKRLELLREVLPKVTRVAVLPTPAPVQQALKEIQTAAPLLQLQLQILKVRAVDELPSAFETAIKGKTGALIVLPDSSGLFFANIKQITDLAVKNPLPTVFATSRYVNAGGLMSYAPNDSDLWRRAATYVDKLLKGAKPADLPVEQPTKFELVINLKTAKLIGLTIPPTVLARADRVIK